MNNTRTQLEALKRITGIKWLSIGNLYMTPDIEELTHFLEIRDYTNLTDYDRAVSLLKILEEIIDEEHKEEATTDEQTLAAVQMKEKAEDFIFELIKGKINTFNDDAQGFVELTLISSAKWLFEYNGHTAHFKPDTSMLKWAFLVALDCFDERLLEGDEKLYSNLKDSIQAL